MERGKKKWITMIISKWNGVNKTCLKKKTVKKTENNFWMKDEKYIFSVGVKDKTQTTKIFPNESTRKSKKKKIKKKKMWTKFCEWRSFK